MSLDDFILFLFLNNQEKFTTRSSKLKVHRANSQTTSSYPVRFSSDILFSFLVSFAFFVFLFSFFVFVLKLKIYILIHIQLCRQVTDKETFTWPDIECLFELLLQQTLKRRYHKVQMTFPGNNPEEISVRQSDATLCNI